MKWIEIVNTRLNVLLLGDHPTQEEMDAVVDLWVRATSN